MLNNIGVPYEVLDRAGCIAAEPALARVKGKIAGGLRLPEDETGDCHMFTRRWRAWPKRSACASCSTSASTASSPMARASRCPTGAGMFRPTPTSWRSAATRRGCAPLGIPLPVYPVKGYSITVPITDAAGAPESTVMDETYKVAITRLGNRIRVGGTAEVSRLFEPKASPAAAPRSISR